jgi:uncharacterized membrane protein
MAGPGNGRRPEAPAPPSQGADAGAPAPTDATRPGGPADGASDGPGPFDRTDTPLLALTLWPNRSLSPRGFAGFLVLLAVCLSVPLLPLLGTGAAWGLLPFLVGMLVAVYAAIRRSYADGRLVEELRLWPDLITVERREPRGAVRRWHANPNWVRLRLLENARIEKYLTLEGNGREIELGAFLSPEERQRLHGELRAALSGLGAPRSPTPAKAG